MSTSISTGLAASIRNLAPRPKLVIDITIHDRPQDAFHPLVYTSLDEIKGQVSITSQNEVRFDDIYITFEGSTKTYVEKIATASPTNSKTEAFQNFLRLMQPFDPEAFPEPRVLEANKTYRFPFHFVVPARLLPQSCNHPVESHFDRNAHSGLPPTLGDVASAAGNKSLLHDMAPEMGCIAYSIKCRITSGRGPSGKYLILAEKGKNLRVVPAVEEEPPLDVKGGVHDDYMLRKEKSIRKGIFRQKMGKLTMESVQPKSLRLPGVRSDDKSPVTTMATVNLRFDPLDAQAQPPRLEKMASKLKVATFYATTPQKELPLKSTDFHYNNFRGLYVETVPLSSRCLANTTWQEHAVGSDVSLPHRSDTTMSTASTKIPAPSDVYNPSYPFYTAHVVVPISLPRGNRVFVPSFHSCLVSRVYALDLYISVNTPNATVTDPTVHLKLPIQVSSAGEAQTLGPMTAQEASAIASQDADAFFQPRNIAPPTSEFTESSPSILGTSGTEDRSPRTAEEPPPFSTPRTTFTNRDSIAEESADYHPQPRPQLTGLGIFPQAVEDVPPSPGPGYTHRPSADATTAPILRAGTRHPSYHVRMVGTTQRFQSLSFENEDQPLAPPPDYDRYAGRAPRRMSSTVSPTTSPVSRSPRRGDRAQSESDSSAKDSE